MKAPNGPEVLIGNNRINQEMSYFVNKYEREASPDDSPTKQAYMLG